LASSHRSELGQSWCLAALLALAGAAASAGEAPLEVLGAGGERVELSRGDGRSALIVHFWASWCRECAAELPELEAVAERCTGTVRVALVNVGESQAVAERFRARHGLRMPLLRDPHGKLFRQFARGLPANLIWTAEGRRVVAGPYAREQWRAQLAALGCAP
jgi:thiol-disulfide isomerase/thioredoxin